MIIGEKNIKRSGTNPFLIDSAVMISGGVLLGLFNYLFTIIMAHIFSITRFGEFQVYANIITLISVIGSGPSYYALRLSAWSSESASHDELSSLVRLYQRYKVYIIGLLASAIAIILLAVFFATHLHGIIPFFLIVFAVLTGVIEGFFSGIVQGTKRFLRWNGINIVSALLQILCATLIGYLTHSPVWALLGFVVSQIYALYFFERIAADSFSSGSASWESGIKKLFTSSLLREIGMTFLFSLGLVVLSNGDIILSRLSLSPEMLGFMSIFLIVGKMILFSNLALMAVVLSYAPQGSLSQQQGTSIALLAYALVGGIGFLGICMFLLIPRFILHVLFHVPANSFLEPILWRSGVIELLLSLLFLEANISFGRKVRGVPALLVVIAIGFCVAMYFGGHSVQSLAYVLMGIYGLGWVLLGVYRLTYSRR